MCGSSLAWKNGLGSDGVCGQGKKFLVSYCSLPHCCSHCQLYQRFARADKRAKLPRWINQYITETASNLSTDMALTLSKLFMRTISQNQNQDQTGVSLWTVEDIEKAQAKQRELALEVEAEQQQRQQQRAAEMMDVDDDDDEYGDGGLGDNVLATIDLNV